MPTSADRAHIGNLVLQYRPGTTTRYLQDFDSTWLTDARRIYVIGDLFVFDYGDTRFTVLEPEVKMPPQELGDHALLLRENVRDYGARA